MNTRHLLLASLAGGLISTVLVNTPYVSLVNLLICAGFWIGPIAAVWTYRRLNGEMATRDAVIIGVLTGVWHGLFGMLLSPLGFAGAGGLLRELHPLMSGPDWSVLESTMKGIGGVLFNIIGVGVDIAFGFIGGLIGGAIFRARSVIA